MHSDSSLLPYKTVSFPYTLTGKNSTYLYKSLIIGIYSITYNLNYIHLLGLNLNKITLSHFKSFIYVVFIVNSFFNGLVNSNTY
jgi:hypothetical protein